MDELTSFDEWIIEQSKTYFENFDSKMWVAVGRSNGKTSRLLKLLEELDLDHTQIVPLVRDKR